MSDYIDVATVGKVVLVAVLAGAGLPLVFSLGLRSLSVGTAEDAQTFQLTKSPAALVAGVLCLALVAVARMVPPRDPDRIEHGARIEFATYDNCCAGRKRTHEPTMAPMVLKRALDKDDRVVHFEHGVRAQNNPNFRQILPMGTTCALRKTG